MHRTLKNNNLNVRALRRARALREVYASLFFTLFLFMAVHSTIKPPLNTIIVEKQKYYIALDDFECRVVVNCLGEMRNSLIATDKYTDAVDEVPLKTINAKQKKFKVIYKEA